MNIVQRQPSLSHGAPDSDNVPPVLEDSYYADDDDDSENDGASFVSALAQANAISSPRAALGSPHQSRPSGSRNVEVTSRVMDDEMPALMSCSSSEGSDEYTDSEEYVRNDGNQQPNEEAVADSWGDVPTDLENHASDFGGFDDIEGLHGLFPPSWAANITTGNAPLSPSWNTDTLDIPELFEGELNNVFDLLLGPNPNFTRPQNAESNQLGEDRAKKLLDALEVLDENLLGRFFALKAGSGEDGRGCAVCYEDLKGPVGKVVALPCTHVFHENCLLPWFQNRSTCPSCRFDLDPER